MIDLASSDTDEEIQADIIDMKIMGYNLSHLKGVKVSKIKIPGKHGSIPIHGYHGGTRIREALEDEFSYGRDSKVKWIKQGNNPGITELILREL